MIQADKEDTNKVNHLIKVCMEYISVGNYQYALKYAEKAQQLAVNLKYKKGIATSYNSIGNIYWYQGIFNKALMNHLKSLAIREEISDKEGIAASYTNIGNIYFRQGNYEKTLENYLISLKIREEIGDKKGLSGSYNNIGNIYNIQENNPEALKNYFKSLKISVEIGDKRGIATSYDNIGVIYKREDNYIKALEAHSKSLKIEQEIGNKEGIINSYINMSDVYTILEEYKKAIDFLNQSLTLSKEIGYKIGTETAYYSISKLYEKQGNYQQAYNYYKLFSETKDSIFNEESNKQIAEMQTKYETEKKEAENQLLTKDNALKDANLNSQRLFIYGISIVLILAIGMVVLIFVGYKRKQQTNLLLEQKNTAIELQKNIIEKKNTQITDSIDYAKNIQDAILPLTSDIKAAFTDAFILYQPKDIVSGDFYWFYHTEQHLFLSVIDCTGHGVPGAFMSLMAYNLLEKIVKQQNINNPSEILDRLNIAVLDILKQHHEESTAKFGMDMSLIRIDKATKQLEFSGAHNSLYIINNNQLTELKADPVSIGTKRQITSHFTSLTYQLIKNDQLYLFTDGYAEQISGRNRKRF